MTHFCNCNKKYPTDGYCGACGRDIEPKTKCNSLGCWIEPIRNKVDEYDSYSVDNNPIGVECHANGSYRYVYKAKKEIDMINTIAQPSCKEITDHKLWTSKMNFSIWMKDNSNEMMCIHAGTMTNWKLGDITRFDPSLVPYHGKVIIEE